MTLAKGKYTISVTAPIMPGAKRMELLIGCGNEIVKVASFSNNEKAQMFCDWLSYFLDFRDEPGKEVNDGTRV